MLVAIANSTATSNGVESPAQAVVRRLFSAFNRHDLDAIAHLYAGDAVLDSTDFCAKRLGPEAVRRTYSELFRLFPDITDRVVASVASEDRVAVQFVSHSQGFMPTQEIRLATFFTIRNGLILTDETYFDAQGRPCT
jgi:ketosteroid isomerase-like protein